jgi:hypothetical protein
MGGKTLTELCSKIKYGNTEEDGKRPEEQNGNSTLIFARSLTRHRAQGVALQYQR